jgi:hypothetical protein
LKRYESSYVTKEPTRRPLKIFAADPMLGRMAATRITIDIENEPLEQGPKGSRIHVIDYDGPHKQYYAAVNLNEPAILMQGGLDPSESDPRFHQQMVYAVAMKVVENFEFALGRRIGFSDKHNPQLRLFPHAFHGANAFFDNVKNAIFFGYFRANTADAGHNMPGQNVFTCLSHDIIAHEMTHAIVNRLRRYFIEPTNVDVLAFHEGFSDIVALFQHFSFPELLREQIQSRRSNLREADLLVSMAQQFGYATGQGKALRSALGDSNPALYANVFEPHARGSILVGAVFDGFFEIYQRRISDLIRIATGGTGNLPEADLHPDLVNRIADEAASSSQTVLGMCIRAFDYLPPVDVTFGDFLRALVTADYELLPDDEYGQRECMIEAFRARGIYPNGVPSMAEESLIWPSAPEDFPSMPRDIVDWLVMSSVRSMSPSRTAGQNTVQFESEKLARQYEVMIEDVDEADLQTDAAIALSNYADANRAALGLHPTLTIHVSGFHSVFKRAPHGLYLVEVIAQFVQTDRDSGLDLGGLPLRGGTTVIAGADGTVRYRICKPLLSDTLSEGLRAQADARLSRVKSFINLCDARDPRLAWGDSTYETQRMLLRASFQSLHSG